MDIKGLKGKVKDLEWKKLLLEKGEKIGLAVASAFAVLMLLPLLAYLILGNGPNANASLLKEPTEQLATKQEKSQPTNDDKPPPATQVVIKETTINDPDRWQLALLSSGGAGNDPTKRRLPEVFPPVEAIAGVAHPQVARYVFDRDLKKIYVAKESGAPAKVGGPGEGGGINPRHVCWLRRPRGREDVLRVASEAG